MSIPRQRWSRRQGFGSAHLGVKKPRRSKIYHSITRDKTLSLVAAVKIARDHETTSKHMKTLTKNSKNYQEGRNIDAIRKEQEREFCNNNSSSTTPQGSTTTAGVQMSSGVDPQDPAPAGKPPRRETENCSTKSRSGLACVANVNGEGEGGGERGFSRVLASFPLPFFPLLRRIARAVKSEQRKALTFDCYFSRYWLRYMNAR